MTTTDGTGRRARRPAKRIAGIYALVAGIWIVLSDAVLGSITGADGTSRSAGVGEGLAFVAVPAALLHALVCRAVADEQAVQGRLQAILDGSPSAICVKDAREALPAGGEVEIATGVVDIPGGASGYCACASALG